MARTFAPSSSSPNTLRNAEQLVRVHGLCVPGRTNLYLVVLGRPFAVFLKDVLVTPSGCRYFPSRSCLPVSNIRGGVVA